MDLQTLLTPARTLLHAQASSKKSLLELTSRLLAREQPGVHAHDILDKFIERERLGSTAIGHGVAIPHSRMAIKMPAACFVHLDKGISFDGADDEPVDLVFAFIIPEDQIDTHIQLISHLATLFNQPQFRGTLRACDTAKKLYDTLIHLEVNAIHE